MYDVLNFRTQGRPNYYLDETWVCANNCSDTVCDTTVKSEHYITIKSEHDTSFKSKYDITVEPKHDLKSNHYALNKGLLSGAVNAAEKGLTVLHIASDKGLSRFIQG